MNTTNHGDEVRADLVIRGRVQGVYYRASARDEAQRLGLRGFVRNCDDGSVAAVVVGPKPDVERFIAWCHEGPPAASVEDVEVRWVNATGRFDGFRVER